jgi:hypothetical protein
MAEKPNQQANTAQGQGQTQPQGQAQGSQPNAGQVQEPEWFQTVPEQHREEAKKGWMMESDYRKKTSELSEQRKGWESEKQKLEEQNKVFNDWYQKEYLPFYTRLQNNWDKVSQVLNGQAMPQNNAAQQNLSQNQQSDVFQDYEVLPPAEQAKRLAEYVNNQYVSRALTSQEQKLGQAVAGYVNYFQNYLNILTDAFSRKVNDPGFDIPKAMQKALEYKSGNFNPLDMVYNEMTADSRQKKMEEEWIKKGKEEALLELQNQQQSTGAIQQSYVPVFKQKPMTRDQIAERQRDMSVKKGYGWD